MKYLFVQQETENDCGLACLAMIYRFYFKKKLLINDIKKDIFLTKLGINLLELKQLTSNYNLLLEAYNNNFDKLKSLIIAKPLIIKIYNANVGFHFIVIYKKKNNKWLVANPEDIELSWKNIEDFTTIFTNVVISTNIINNFFTLFSFYVLFFNFMT
ncbi:cysteine peptidase family C39 domain-containing protein [Spiroplasma endosymbiont of Notiophilus biguttatus]|uniref:cysteine peptidase family C39 domain-containing protein n=1 Tax=Spiroplasma endosymbiont of Notiophilus biguttatus TaxID=3066285 RepID=UPI00313CE5F1